MKQKNRGHKYKDDRNLETAWTQWRTQEFCSEGVQQIQLRTEDRENGDLGGGGPLVRGSGGSCNLVRLAS